MQVLSFVSENKSTQYNDKNIYHLTLLWHRMSKWINILPEKNIENCRCFKWKVNSHDRLKDKMFCSNRRSKHYYHSYISPKSNLGSLEPCVRVMHGRPLYYMAWVHIRWTILEISMGFLFCKINLCKLSCCYSFYISSSYYI